MLDLQAAPAPAWLQAAVTFRVTCQSVVGNTDLSYLWTFGDGTTETTSQPADVHSYSSSGNYTYSVKCTDGAQSSQIASPQPLVVLDYNLNSVAAGTCSTGLQGLGWCWQRPLPTGANLRALTAITPLSSWVVGQGGAVLVTNDGGVTWTPRFPSAEVDFLAIHSTDHNHVTLAATDGSVWATADGGVTWTNVRPAGGPYDLTAVSMADENHIFAIDGGASIVQTGNGGSTWSTVDVAGGLPIGTALNAISAGSAASVWAVGNLPAGQGASVGAGVTASTADGVTWSAGSPPAAFAGLALDSVSVTTASKCLSGGPVSGSVWIAGLQPGGATDANGVVSGVESAESIDNGTDWSLSATGGGALLAAFDAKTAWQTLPYTSAEYAGSLANDGFGHTSTGNTGWLYPSQTFPYYIQFPSSEDVFPTIRAIDSADCNTGWAVGDRGTILVTTDGGASWIGQAAAQVPSTANNLTSIAALSATQAYALAVDASAIEDSATSYHTEDVFQVLSTNDGGITWLTEIAAIESMAFNLKGSVSQAPLTQLTHGQIAANAAGDIIAAGPGFVIARSSIAQTFSYHSSSETDEAANVVGPPPKGDATGWGYTNSGSAIVVNGLLPNQAYEVWKAVSVSSKSAWVIDSLGDVIEQPTPVNPSGVANHGWKLVAGAASLKTQPASQPPPAGGNAIAAVDLNSGIVAVIVGANGLITRSVDVGNTWVTAPPIATADLNAVGIVSDGASAGVGWAVGASGTILRTTDAGATWTQQSWSDPTISATNVAFSAISTFDGQNAWAVGQQTNCSASNCSVLIHTSDGGMTWTRQPTGATGLNSVVAVDANTGWLVGINGDILKTVTGGVAPL